MLIGINSRQADKLSSFFFDLAKGVALGILGLSVTVSNVSQITKLLNIFAGLFLLNEND